MKTARDFVVNDLEASMTFDDDVKCVEARDREVRAAALREALEALKAATLGIDAQLPAVAVVDIAWRSVRRLINAAEDLERGK